MSGFFSGSLDPFWPHSVLLTIAVLSSFAVAAGIVLENPKWSLANALVIGGVAIEAACTLLLFGFDEGISGKQQLEILTATDRATDAGFDAAIANNAAAEAIERAENLESENLKLRIQLQPRSLRGDDIAAFNNALKSVSGTLTDVYIFPAGTPDTVPLGRAIAAVIKQAGWDIGRIETASGGQYFVGVGVWVNPNADERVKAAHAALMRLLATLGPNPNPDMRVTAGAFAVEGLASGIPDWTRVVAPLAVLVGTKP